MTLASPFSTGGGGETFEKLAGACGLGVLSAEPLLPAMDAIRTDQRRITDVGFPSARRLKITGVQARRTSCSRLLLTSAPRNAISGSTTARPWPASA